MDAGERFVRVCGEVGNFTARRTGVSIVDAYFGEPDLAPAMLNRDKNADTLLSELGVTIDSVGELQEPLRRDYLVGETRSLEAVVRWINGENTEFLDLVQRLFNIRARLFTEREVEEAVYTVEESTNRLSEGTLSERIDRLLREGEISGDELKRMIEVDLQQKTNQVTQLFRERIYSQIGESVTDNGVMYQTVKHQPWSGYNYFQGNFRSINKFNLDRPMNRESLLSVVYHEYEHHVHNLWREKHYREKGYVELSVIPLHTGWSVISEGCADTAREFLGIAEESPRVKALDSLYHLRRMVSINTAILLNQDMCSTEEAVDYMHQKGLYTRECARAALSFITPTTTEGRPNIWAPYVFTYLFGRRDFVLPTYKRAVHKGRLREFYRTLYMNPFSGSSVTWATAFKSL